MSRLRFTTLVAAPLTVAFDVARALGRPWPVPLAEVSSVRPVGDVYAATSGRVRIVHSRRFVPTAAGTVVEEHLDRATALPRPLGPGVDLLLRRQVRRAMRAHLDGYAAAAARRARDVVQVVGAALVDGDRVLVAQRSGGPHDGRWEFPGGKVEPGEGELAGLVREIAEELGADVVPEAFVGEVVLDGAVAGGPPGGSTLRVWSARLRPGSAVTAREHGQLRWMAGEELASLDWIPADRPLLPAVRALLARP